jgi:MFS transporter, NRE family, putaive nickel resistance protein
MFQALKNPTFARLYIAQAISLLGDALTWLGLALLAVELAGANAPNVLATALTCRIIAFIVCAPIVGIIADQVDRQLILIGTHLVRMVLVGLLPFVQTIWQLYAIVLVINIFHACFTPTYQAAIPVVTKPHEYAPAMALASVTYQTLSMIGPGLAGLVAGWLGARTIFWLDSGSFLLAAVVIATIRQPLTVATTNHLELQPSTSYVTRLTIGTQLLFGDRFLRYALLLQLVGAIIGSQILVNTVSYVRSILLLGDREYSWVMMAFGVGMVIAAVLIAKIHKSVARHWVMFCSAVVMIVAMFGADRSSLLGLILLWVWIGIGKNLIDLPTQIAIGERIPRQQQGQVYAAHFAWSHLWWGVAYPLAGWLGTMQPQSMFAIAAGIGLLLLMMVQLCLAPSATVHTHPAVDHTHLYRHDRFHQHSPDQEAHVHVHHHHSIEHTHFYWLNNHQHH